MCFVLTRCPRQTPAVYVGTSSGPRPLPVQLHLVWGVSHPDAKLGGGPGRPRSWLEKARLCVECDRQPVSDAEPLHAVRRADAEVHGPARSARSWRQEHVFVYPQ